MEKEEFIIRARALGYSEEYIAESIRIHENAAKDGIIMDYEDDVAEPMPIEVYPTSN